MRDTAKSLKEDTKKVGKGIRVRQKAKEDKEDKEKKEWKRKGSGEREMWRLEKGNKCKNRKPNTRL